MCLRLAMDTFVTTARQGTTVTVKCVMTSTIAWTTRVERTATVLISARTCMTARALRASHLLLEFARRSVRVKVARTTATRMPHAIMKHLVSIRAPALLASQGLVKLAVTRMAVRATRASLE